MIENRSRLALRRSLFLGAVCAAAIAAAPAQTRPTSRPAKASAKRALTRPGKARKAYGVRWQPTLGAALTAAGRRHRRPVLGFRVLGELTGFA